MPACCFTGHRELSPDDQRQLIPRLTDEIEQLILKGVTVFRNGGAIGFDAVAALCVLALKNKYPNIQLCMHVPHKGQAGKWSASQKGVYKSILSRADYVIYHAEKYFSGCMHNRNRSMVDLSDYVIAYIRQTKGGTYFTVNYAESKNKQVIYL